MGRQPAAPGASRWLAAGQPARAGPFALGRAINGRNCPPGCTSPLYETLALGACGRAGGSRHVDGRPNERPAPYQRTSQGHLQDQGRGQARALGWPRRARRRRSRGAGGGSVYSIAPAALGTRARSGATTVEHGAITVAGSCRERLPARDVSVRPAAKGGGGPLSTIDGEATVRRRSGDAGSKRYQRGRGRKHTEGRQEPRRTARRPIGRGVPHVRAGQPCLYHRSMEGSARARRRVAGSVWRCS